MLVASKKKIEQITFPTVDYGNETKDQKGEDKKVVSKVGFYEIEKKKVKSDNGIKRIVGDVIKDHFIPTEDENFFKKQPYSGKTLMISIENSRFTIVRREAEEADKIKFKEAYELHLEHKAQEDAKNAELKEMQEKIKSLEAEKSKKVKEPKEPKEKTE